jgi:hypothetical protein
VEERLSQLLKLEQRPFKWTQNFADLLALNHFPEHLLRQLKAYCDLNPIGAEDFIKFVIEVFDSGRENGIDEIATGGRH